MMTATAIPQLTPGQADEAQSPQRWARLVESVLITLAIAVAMGLSQAPALTSQPATHQISSSTSP
jgi:hypothetical protein